MHVGFKSLEVSCKIGINHINSLIFIHHTCYRPLEDQSIEMTSRVVLEVMLLGVKLLVIRRKSLSIFRSPHMDLSETCMGVTGNIFGATCYVK